MSLTPTNLSRVINISYLDKFTIPPGWTTNPPGGVFQKEWTDDACQEANKMTREKKAHESII